VDSGGSKEPCIRWGPISPQGKGQLWGTTCDAAFSQNSLTACFLVSTESCDKNLLMIILVSTMCESTKVSKKLCACFLSRYSSESFKLHPLFLSCFSAEFLLVRANSCLMLSETITICLLVCILSFSVLVSVISFNS